MKKEEIEEQMWVNYDEGYKAGCSETIKKACEWLNDKLPLYWSQVNADNTDRFVRLFKKYMEEQQ